MFKMTETFNILELYVRVHAHMVQSMHQANYRYTGTDVQLLTLEIAVLNPSS